MHFMDSMKFFLSLYGHKLPVLSMDISSDSSLLISGSADKNIKIWGLDFGDCHRSLFAHADSIMQANPLSHALSMFGQPSQQHSHKSGPMCTCPGLYHPL